MQISVQELVVINTALQVDDKMNPKQYPISELQQAQNIYLKLKDCTEFDGEIERFKDSEIDFSTEDKSFILGIIESPWGINMADAYFSLKEKLS